MLQRIQLVPFLAVVSFATHLMAGGNPPASKSPRVRPESAAQWQVRHGSNFVVHYLSGDEAQAGTIVECAERTRLELYRDWFAIERPVDWSPKCHIYVHSNSFSYGMATEDRATSSGYSVTRSNRGRIVSQRIDVLKDGSDLVHAVLPHELAHVLLSNHFVHRPLPLWAEEGLAVMAETPEIRQAHRRNLDHYARRGVLFSAAEIMNMRDYPSGEHRGVFYAQSVSLVEFLISRRGTPKFMEFLSQTNRPGAGNELVLKRLYDVASLTELHQNWLASSLSVNKLGMAK